MVIVIRFPDEPPVAVEVVAWARTFGVNQIHAAAFSRATGDGAKRLTDTRIARF